MLKYINYQLESDDARQAQLEQAVSAQINQRFKANTIAFAQHIPGIVPMIEQHAIQQYSVFCTRQGELNIVAADQALRAQAHPAVEPGQQARARPIAPSHG